jgi:uncharacterized protein with PIN domain
MAKFFCDQDVLKLEKYLKSAGFDTISIKCLSKKKMNAYCKKYRRILITRNKNKEYKQFSCSVEILNSDNVKTQFTEITSKYNKK